MSALDSIPTGPTPKQPQQERLRDWYPYYAGFSREFASAVARRYLGSPRSLIDPWNGSGTTTELAARLGLPALGSDLNPATRVIAEARLYPRNEASKIEGSLGVFDDLAASASRTIDEADPLLHWFRRPAATRLRGLVDSIPAFIDQLEVPDRPPSEVKRLSELASAFMTAALMAAVRDLMAPFRSSNPTWIRMPASFRNKLAPSRGAIAHQLGERCRYLSQRLQVERLADSLDIQIHCDSALDLTADGVWGGCLTSPPYATRIDYVRSSSPELAVLGIGLDEQADLRSKMTGTPVVRGKGREHTSSSRTAQALLAEIKEHGSHGSANYYQPWLLNYFHELEVGLTNAARSVSRDGRLAVVVQDSYYKELHVDLQTVTIELLEVSGRELVHREDFRAPHLISNMNSHARRHRATRRHHETLLVVE